MNSRAHLKKDRKECSMSIPSFTNEWSCYCFFLSQIRGPFFKILFCFLKVMACQGGVMTLSRQTCRYTEDAQQTELQCDQILPARPGECCPRCRGNLHIFN